MLRWVPSHLGIEGNEVADDWARSGGKGRGLRLDGLPPRDELC